MAVTTNYLAEKIRWKQNADDAIQPYIAEFEGHKCLIRINDFPDDRLYTLIVDDKEVEGFDDWPEKWSRPRLMATQNHRRKLAAR
jgi:hypothetical protein